MHFFTIFPVTALLIHVANSQSCDNSYGMGYEAFEPYFFLNSMSSPNVTCNIDPSQSNLDYAVAVGGEFCVDMTDPVTLSMAYTGTDGMISTASVVTTVSEAYMSSVNLIFTGLPASAISNGSPLTVTAYDSSISGSNCGPLSTTFFQSTFTATQTFIATIFYTDTTTLTTTTVPTTTTTTSTVTNQVVTAAPAKSTTITGTSGTNTVVATTTTTTTSTRTITQKTITRTVFVKTITTTSATCIAPRPSAVNKRNDVWVGRIPNLQMLKRQQDSNNSSATPLTYMTGYCTTPLQTTNIYTSTSTLTSTFTDPSNTTTATEYAVTTTTSTYTPTDTFYVTAVGTTTYTPVVTKKTTTILKKQTTTVTYTTQVTKTKYPKNPPPCATTSSTS